MLRISDHMIKEVVSEVAGEDTIPVVLNIKGKVNVSEFKIAEDLKMDIRELRKKLYRLLEHNLVVFKRKKDKKKGWYIYYWTFQPSQVKFLYKALRERKLEKLKQRLEREENNQFYICPNACVRLDFSKAVEFDFRCPECGSLMVVQDNSATIRHLKEEIERLEKEIKEIEELERKVSERISKAKGSKVKGSKKSKGKGKGKEKKGGVKKVSRGKSAGRKTEKKGKKKGKTKSKENKKGVSKKGRSKGKRRK